MKNIEEMTETAVNKLAEDVKAAEAAFMGRDGMVKRAMIQPIADQLRAFIYQDDTGELARAVAKKGRSLTACLNEVVKGCSANNPALSDVEAYTRAIKYYMPEAKVRCSLRVVIPQEIDEDLLFLGGNEDGGEVQHDSAGAVILDIGDFDDEVTKDSADNAEDEPSGTDGGAVILDFPIGGDPE